MGKKPAASTSWVFSDLYLLNGKKENERQKKHRTRKGCRARTKAKINEQYSFIIKLLVHICPII